MKSVFFAILMSSALCCGAGQKIATQEWVKKFINENAVSKVEIETTESSDPNKPTLTMTAKWDGESVGITNAVSFGMTFSFPTNPVLLVTDSAVTGVEIGTKFVLTDRMTFENSGCIALPVIKYSISEVGESKTNAVGVVSTVIKKVCNLSVEDNGVEKYGFSSAGGCFYLHDNNDVTKYIRLVNSTVTDSEKLQILLGGAVASTAPPVLQRGLVGLTSGVGVPLRAGSGLSWADFDLGKDIRTITLENLFWQDVFGNVHEFIFGDTVFTFSHISFFNTDDPCTLEEFQDPKNWGMEFPLTDSSGNKLTEKQFLSRSPWKEMIKELYNKYIDTIRKIKEDIPHECKFKEGDCNCIWMNDPKNPCDKANPQHEFGYHGGDANACFYCQRCKDKSVKGSEHVGDPVECGCVCRYYNNDGHDQWSDGFHIAIHDEYECWCRCGKRHLRAEESDCPDVCKICDRKTDSSGDMGEHTAISDVSGAATRCGCVCGKYSGEDAKDNMHTMRSGGTKQQGNSSCWCYCGKKHEKISSSECKGTCAICGGTNDSGMDKGPWVCEIDANKLSDHVKSESGCGCKCGALTGTSELISSDMNWHHFASDKCTCSCAMNLHKPVASNCPLICEKCKKKTVDGLQVTAEEIDHVPEGTVCGCKCGTVTSASALLKFHNGQSATKGACYCQCGEKHLGEWTAKTCGANTWYECSRNSNHVREGDVAKHEYANGFHSAAGHYCKCDKKSLSAHQNVKQKSGRGVGFVTYRLVCQVPGCGWFGDETEECNHPEWGTWIKVGEVPGGVLMRQNCANCASFREETVLFDGMEECNTEMNIHLPHEDQCGCKCGYYGVRIAEDEDFHKWDGDKCRCFCEAKHRFKEGSACAKVCATCKTTLKSGATAKESDHTKRSDHACGCKCGYYGVSAAHVASGHNAETAYLHKQAVTANNGSPAYCQCYGAEGKGGAWHWYASRSDTCKKICKYTMTGQSLGHLAAKNSPERGITEATPQDHTEKTYGCGCACGLCGEDTKTYWNDVKRLHKPLQSAKDQCHCSCESRELVGKTEGHTFKTCICTCEEKHDTKNYPLNACGYCSNCGKIWKGGKPQDASIKSEHSFAQGGCYCDGGCVVGGSKILHPEGHRYMKNKCVCLCGNENREHWVVSQKEQSGSWTCWKCSAVFVNYVVNSWCSRCGETLSPEHIGSVGDHYPGCGEPNPNPNNSCWNCRCACGSIGAHPTCNLHYCSACCYEKPKPKPRPDVPDPGDPDVPEDPPEPYVSCAHVYDNDSGSGDWTCDDCGGYFTYWWSIKYCIKCGRHGDSESGEEGEHGPPCTNNTDPDHVCEPTLCGAETTSGQCDEMYCHSCTSTCPNESNHKSHHGGNGNSGGGSGSGGIGDIIITIR